MASEHTSQKLTGLGYRAPFSPTGHDLSMSHNSSTLIGTPIFEPRSDHKLPFYRTHDFSSRSNSYKQSDDATPQPKIAHKLPFYRTHDFSSHWDPYKQPVTMDGQDTSGNGQAIPVLKVSDAGDFGSLQLNEKTRHWKRGNIVQNNGVIEEKVMDWEDDGPIPHQDGVDAAARSGLAAGKMYIGAKHLMGLRSETEWPFETSGICIERGFFLTTCHYKNLDNELENMKHPETAKIRISTAQRSEFPDEDRKIKHAYLIAENKTLDIALFRLKGGEEFQHSIKLDQLMPLAEAQGRHIWSVGYSAVEDHRYGEYFKDYPKLVERNMALKQAFESTLSTSAPDFRLIFYPNRRILVSGLLHDAGFEGESVFHYHSIPGWFGMSGSMMGKLIQTSTGAIETKIIGLFKGGETHELLNRLVPFTSYTINEIKGYIIKQ